MFCPKCGGDNAEGKKFCRHCGTRLGAAAVPSNRLLIVTAGIALLSIGSAMLSFCGKESLIVTQRMPESRSIAPTPSPLPSSSNKMVTSAISSRQQPRNASEPPVKAAPLSNAPLPKSKQQPTPVMKATPTPTFTPTPKPLAKPSQIAIAKATPTIPSNQPSDTAAVTAGISNNGGIEEAGKNGAGKPTILYKERAIYTEEARHNRVQGTVLLSAIFTADSRITGIKVVRPLPDGLTEKAIEATQKIRFQPATKDNIPISVRAQIEFNFALYEGLPAPLQLTPPNGAVFNHYPRATTLRWSRVVGAVKYRVRVEWGTQDGRQWALDREIDVTDTIYTFDFTGAQPGRWQVWAIDAYGNTGVKSEWRVFRFTI